MQRTLLFIFCVLTVVIVCAQTYPEQGGAKITSPFAHDVTGAVCFSGTGKIAGSVFFNFPTQDRKVLAFVLGPAAPGQEDNDKYQGAGTYTNINIYLKPPHGQAVSKIGQIVVDDNERSGSFNFQPPKDDKAKKDDKANTGDDDDDDDNENPNTAGAAGTWNCGRKLTKVN